MAHAWPPRRRRIREALGYLRWCYLPWRTTAVTGVDDLRATRALSDHGLYLNLGYWREARTIDDACQALVRLVAATAALGPRDRLLDVTSLWGDVCPPLHRWLAQPGRLRRFHPLARLPWYALRRLDARFVYGAVDYVLVSADKPA